MNAGIFEVLHTDTWLRAARTCAQRCIGDTPSADKFQFQSAIFTHGSTDWGECVELGALRQAGEVNCVEGP